MNAEYASVSSLAVTQTLLRPGIRLRRREVTVGSLSWNDSKPSKDFGEASENNVAIFWNLAPCSPYVNRRFGGTYHLHLQG
jgi:hypothetical protein